MDFIDEYRLYRSPAARVKPLWSISSPWIKQDIDYSIDRKTKLPKGETVVHQFTYKNRTVAITSRHNVAVYKSVERLSRLISFLDEYCPMNEYIERERIMADIDDKLKEAFNTEDKPAAKTSTKNLDKLEVEYLIAEAMLEELDGPAQLEEVTYYLQYIYRVTFLTEMQREQKRKKEAWLQRVKTWSGKNKEED